MTTAITCLHQTTTKAINITKKAIRTGINKISPSRERGLIAYHKTAMAFEHAGFELTDVQNAKLEIKKGWIIKYYSLTLSGTDTTHKMMNGLDRNIVVTFDFSSIYGRKKVAKILYGITRVGFVTSKDRKHHYMSVNKHMDRTFLVDRTVPERYSIELTRTEGFDAWPTFFKECKSIGIPDGLVIE